MQLSRTLYQPISGRLHPSRMPQQTDAAARMRLQDIDDTMHGQKLRVAGRCVCALLRGGWHC